MARPPPTEHCSREQSHKSGRSLGASAAAIAVGAAVSSEPSDAAADDAGAPVHSDESNVCGGRPVAEESAVTVEDSLQHMDLQSNVSYAEPVDSAQQVVNLSPAAPAATSRLHIGAPQAAAASDEETSRARQQGPHRSPDTADVQADSSAYGVVDSAATAAYASDLEQLLAGALSEQQRRAAHGARSSAAAPRYFVPHRPPPRELARYAAHGAAPGEWEWDEVAKGLTGTFAMQGGGAFRNDRSKVNTPASPVSGPVTRCGSVWLPSSPRHSPRLERPRKIFLDLNPCALTL